MKEETLARTIVYEMSKGQRKMGRPKARWKEDSGKDAINLGIRSLRFTAMKREEWKKRQDS